MRKPGIYQTPIWPYFPRPVGLWGMLPEEVGGTVVRDLSGNGNDGTITGATWVPGKFGRALKFDGVVSCISLGSGATLNPNMSMSISVWIRTAIADGGDGNYYCILDGTNNTQYYLGIENNGDLEFNDFVVGDMGYDVGVYGDVWHHIVITLNNTTSKLYWDGILLTTGSTDRTGSTAGAVYVGSWRNIGRYFNGEIDNLSIFDFALTASQVAQCYIDPFPWFVEDVTGLYVPAGGISMPLVMQQMNQFNGGAAA